MKILRYRFLSCEINNGTEDAPDIERVFLDKEIQCSEDAFESNYAMAQKEACNGEVTVEEVADPETEPTTEEILNTILGVTK